MLFALKSLARFVRLFRRNEDGGPTVEFVLIFMPFMVLIVSGFELGLLMTRHVMMERGVTMATRIVRINTGARISEDNVKKMVCNTSGFIKDCTNQVRLEMIGVDMWQQSSVGPTTISNVASCRDESEDYTFENADANQVVIVRACGLFTPMLPEFGLGYFLSRQRPDGYYPLVTTTAFVMEPV